MRIVVSDSSCLIDLRKASLLDALVRLPYELLIPNTLFEDELLKFTAEQKRALLGGGDSWSVPDWSVPDWSVPAVNVDLAESDLTALDESSLRQTYPVTADWTISTAEGRLPQTAPASESGRVADASTAKSTQPWSRPLLRSSILRLPKTTP